MKNHPARALIDAGLELERGGKPRDALLRYLAAMKQAPRDAGIRELAARAATAAGDARAAAEHARAGLLLDPVRATLRTRLVTSLIGSGQLAEAEAEARLLADRSPQDGEAANLLGVVLKRLGRIADAVAAFRRGTEVAPQHQPNWYNLGNTLLGQGDAEAALAPLGRALDLQVDSAETARLLGQALAEAGRPGQALALIDRAGLLDPNNPRVFTSRAAALQVAGAPDAAVLAEIDRAIQQEPDAVRFRLDRASYLQQRKRFEEAVEAYRAILADAPDHVDTLLRLGQLLGFSLRRYEEANALLRRAVELSPGDPRSLAALCKSLIDSRYGDESAHVEEAGQVARALLDLAPDLRPISSNLVGIFLRLVDYEALDRLMTDRTDDFARFWIDRRNIGAFHNQLGRVRSEADRHDLIRWHRAWGDRICADAAKKPVRRPPPRGLREKVRVGFLSSDLRNHPVGYFALPIFEHLDRERFEPFVYTFYPGDPDNVAQFVRSRSAGYRHMTQATDPEVAQAIADDDLDILFELGGTTRYNRLEVTAYRAAPRQVSWLGYPHSAGIAAIDQILVDPYLMPPDPALLIEQPFTVPESWVVLGRLGFREEAVTPGLPDERQGAITFGTMNNPLKYTRACIAAWGAVMARVPGSRFLFVRPEAGSAAFRANIAREFATAGIAADRIDYVGVRGAHLPHYNRIDVALDTFPQTGGTTTCETLWMGVPVVSLAGPAFFERLSYSNLSNAGLGDLCAHDVASYVETAVRIAEDRERRRELRANLRTRLRTLPLGDEVRWVRNFERTIRATVGA